MNAPRLIFSVRPTPTGIEPNSIQTSPAYPYNQAPVGSFPIIAQQPRGNGSSSSSSSGSSANASLTGSGFDITKYWGNLSPWYSLRSADYGLPQASPQAPPGCTITQMMLLYRHGARYPTSGALPSTFAGKLHNATLNGTVTFSGELSFLSTWNYKLGAELLTPFGRGQNFMLGVSHRSLYGHLLNNFTQAGTLPVFRTQSQDRMVKTANNFAAGFFGVPEYLSEVNIEIIVEALGVNNSGAAYEVCPNSNTASKGSIGSTYATKFAAGAFNSTLSRLQSQTTGLNYTSQDIIAMLQLCSYESVALGYSQFCGLFTEQDFSNYEYYYDLSFYYNNGVGSPVAAAQGKGYLDEYLARFTQKYPQANSALNLTYDNTTTYFPLNNSIYADATHEVIVLDTLTAFNLTALFQGPPPTMDNKGANNFGASKLVPFATHFTTQVLECPAYSPSKQMRFIV